MQKKLCFLENFSCKNFRSHVWPHLDNWRYSKNSIVKWICQRKLSGLYVERFIQKEHMSASIYLSCDEKLIVSGSPIGSLEEPVSRPPQKKHARIVSFTDSVTMKNKAHAESLTSESSAPNDKQVELFGEISQLRYWKNILWSILDRFCIVFRQEIRELQHIQVKRQAEEEARKRDAMSESANYAAVMKYRFDKTFQTLVFRNENK